MSETSAIMRVFEENPKTAAATVSGTVGIFNWALFDPNRHCSVLMSIISAMFTYCLLIAFMSVSFIETADQLINVCIHLIGLAGATITTLGIYKKYKATRRKRRVLKVSKKNDN